MKNFLSILSKVNIKLLNLASISLWFFTGVSILMSVSILIHLYLGDIGLVEKRYFIKLLTECLFFTGVIWFMRIIFSDIFKFKHTELKN
jgi:hypothetical protein